MKNSIAFILCATLVSSVMAHPGVSIVMDKKGSVYYSDLKQVWKIDTQGKKTVVVSGVHTHELFMDDTDNLYGEHLWYNGEKADTWGHYVWKLSPAGKLDRIKPSTTGIPNDYSFVRDKNGNMYWADRTDKCQKVIRKNKDGSLTKMGDACMENIRWMTCTPEGVVYIVDLHDIKKMDLHGHIITLTEDVPGKKILSLFVDPTHFLSGISVDSHENVYVADYSAKQVKKITPSKQVSVLAETNTPWSPSGSLLAPNGDFWILENSITNHVRVECITKDGKRIIY